MSTIELSELASVADPKDTAQTPILGGGEENPPVETVSKKKKKKSNDPEIPTVVKTKQFEWAAAKIRYTMNKLYMYKMSVIWIIGVILSVVILWLLNDTPHVYHNMHAFREGFITQEFLFEDSHIQKCYLDVDEAGDYYAWIRGVVFAQGFESGDYEELMGFNYNRVLGSVTLRQFRVKQGVNCAITPKMATVLSRTLDENGEPVPSTDCYPEYSESVRCEETFGPKKEWSFSKSKAPRVSGWVASYGSDAYVTELSRNPVVAIEQIEYMDENDYIDQSTSAVVTTINTFNPNINYFCSSVFVTEFPVGGDACVDIHIRPFKSSYYFSDTDIARAVLEGFFVVWLLFHLGMIMKIVFNEIRAGRSVLKWLHTPWWNFIFVLSISFYIVTIIWYVIMVRQSDTFVAGIKNIADTKDFEDMEAISESVSSWTYFAACSIVIGILSFFRYITFNPRMSILWLTVQRAGGDLFTFLIFFAIVFLAFVFFAVFVYGAQMFEYSEWQWALVSSLRGVFGDIDYDSMFLVHHTITPIYFFAFTIIIIFILMNMFVAIISDAYAAVNEEAASAPTITSSITTFFAKKIAKCSEDPDAIPPKMGRTEMMKLFKRTANRTKVPELTKEQVARLPGFQDMCPETFEEVWKRVALATETSATEKQEVGLGDDGNDDDDVDEDENAEDIEDEMMEQ